MNVPKLRFSEFSDEYSNLYLSDITTLIKDGTHGTHKNYEGGIPLLSAKDIYNNKINIPKDCRRISLEDYNKIYKNYSLIQNDILLTIVGSIGRTALYNNEKISFQRSVATIRINQQNSPKYIRQYIESSIINTQLNNMMNTSAQGGVYLSSLSKLNFNLPNLSEQKKIAHMLELLDKKINLQNKKIEALKLFKKGLLKCEYNKIKSKNLSQLNNVAQIYQPRTLSQKQLKKGVYPVFGANGIIGFNSNFNHKLPQITISCRGENSGSINKTPEYCWINGNSMVINVDNNPNINKDYLKLILESQNLKYLISGSGQPQIIRSDIAKHKIPIISIDEQLIYIKKFNLLESKLPLEISKLKKLNLLKKGLMQNMFI